MWIRSNNRQSPGSRALLNARRFSYPRSLDPDLDPDPDPDRDLALALVSSQAFARIRIKIEKGLNGPTQGARSEP